MLAEAEYGNQFELMTILLRLGASVDPKSSGGTTPFGQACTLGIRRDEAARLLLAWGASTDDCFDGDQQAHQAARESGNFALADLVQTPLGGRRCEISGLKNRDDLNGKTCVAFQYFPKKDRYGVEIEGTNEKVQIKPANLTRRDRTPSDF